MREKERRRKPYVLSLVALACASVALVAMCGMRMESSMAYFTTYASAKGSYELQTGTETEIHEEIDGLNKHIRIENTGNGDCFVRVKVFVGSVNDISYAPENGSWNEGEEEYWYYGKVLSPGEISEGLTASIEVPEGVENMWDSFNVIVIQECTPVLYRADGTPYADWNRKVEKDAGEGG